MALQPDLCLGLFNPPSPGILVLRVQVSQSSASRYLNPPPPGISILRVQVSKSSASRYLNPPPPGISIRLHVYQSSASRYLYSPPPELYILFPDLLQVLRFSALLASLPTASNHLPLGLPTGLLPSVYPFS